MDLSIVVPLHNEQHSVSLLYNSITSNVQSITSDYEILFVDDGSTDATFLEAEKIAAEDKKLRVIKFRRNYGQTPAMAAGIDNARGTVIITMDGDLQNDPGDIPEFLKKIEEGYDIVVGWRVNRQDRLVSRRIPSIVANWIIGKAIGMPIRDNGCSLKAFRSTVIKSIPLYSDMHRFIPALASIAGPKVAEIRIRHHARKFGKSKYGLSRIYKVLFDLLTVKTITEFSEQPLRWFGLLAAPFMISSFFLLGWVFFEFATVGIASLPLVGTGLIFGSCFIFLLFSGALAEMISRTGDLNIGKIRYQTAVEYLDSKPVLAITVNKRGS